MRWGSSACGYGGAQVVGSLVEALGKLKHAYDLWNSSLFLVARREDMERVYQRLEGTFHEIKGRPKVLTPELSAPP